MPAPAVATARRSVGGASAPPARHSEYAGRAFAARPRLRPLPTSPAPPACRPPSAGPARYGRRDGDRRVARRFRSIAASSGGASTFRGSRRKRPGRRTRSACPAAAALPEPDERREAELPAVAVGDGGVADVAFARAEVAGRTLQEQARRTGVPLDHFAHRADVIRADERVLPRERRRVAGVVHDRAERPCRRRRRPLPPAPCRRPGRRG